MKFLNGLIQSSDLFRRKGNQPLNLPLGLRTVMLINKILGTQELPVQAQYYMRTFLYLSMIISFLESLSSTFYILYSIDHIGFALTAVCTSLMLATQLLFDYPSGSLGDWIGQRWVLTMAYIFYGISFIFLIFNKA